MDEITLSISGLDKIKANLGNIKAELEAKLNYLLDKHANNIVTRAKQKVPKDEGILANSISADTSRSLIKHITANAPYAAFVEFGTGRYAAEYVASLPIDWQEFATQFKGLKGQGTFDDMIKNIAGWIHRKGIFADTALHGTYSIKTKKRTGNRFQHVIDDYRLAYIIAVSILKKGMHAQPFLYPAYKETLPELLKELNEIFK